HPALCWSWLLSRHNPSADDFFSFFLSFPLSCPGRLSSYNDGSIILPQASSFSLSMPFSVLLSLRFPFSF
ncbi:unnamed protein product, partial [Coccothraustes coccothraustes]